MPRPFFASGQLNAQKRALLTGSLRRLHTSIWGASANPSAHASTNQFATSSLLTSIPRRNFASTSSFLPRHPQFTAQRFMAGKKIPKSEVTASVTASAEENASLNIFDEAALLTKYDTQLAERLRTTEKIIRPTPNTPGKRHVVRIDRSELWAGRPLRVLTMTKKRHGGRNNTGRITRRGRGGGSRRRLRIVDLKRSVMDMPGVVQRLEYDPNRSAHIALIRYPDGRQTYILAQNGVTPGETVMSSRRDALDLVPGNAMRLRFIPVGTLISCVELQIGHGPQLARAAGVSCELISKESAQRQNYGLLKLSSGEIRLIHLDCLATVGSMSNPLYHIRSLGKAGKTRHMGFRPVSRGLARNPVDHPHGGGAGKGRPGRPSISFSGVLAKGYKTRPVRKPSPFIYTTRHRTRQLQKNE